MKKARYVAVRAKMKAVDYIDFLIAKLIAFAIAAFGWGLYCGFTGRPLELGSPEQQEKRDDLA